MKIAVYTLTRDRLDYTKRSFRGLHLAGGHDFDHFVVDNGSQDGTVEWLRERQDVMLKELLLLEENVGISRASNLALDMISRSAVSYDLIMKFDNDCIILDKGMLQVMVDIFARKPGNRRYLLSPRVVGINRQPQRRTFVRHNGVKLGWVGQVGGLCHVTTGDLYQSFRYDERLPLAWGQDENFCTWARENGTQVGYVEDTLVEHCDTTNGQVERYPEYFERKWKEEELEAPA